ncbi:MAG: LacI family DNA-binding transcriptional regulator [Cytophagales bacterium]|nr:LacI family DNA-binding transcriptional regulator [Armatimonadota bacterium]
MRRSNAPTLQDVASQAGVTAMTVSVVLNGARSATRVSEGTRARILEAAARLHYRPNGVARGLSRRRMDAIGVVSSVRNADEDDNINLYFLEILNGILEAGARHRQNITVFSITHQGDDEPKILQFCDGRVDGMIFVAPRRLSPGFAETLQHHTPFVTMHANDLLPCTYNLDIDNEGGGYQAVQYLISQGHRRIAHFPGQLNLLGPRQRMAGYQRALSEAGIAFDPSLVLEGAYSTLSGKERAGQLLSRSGICPLPTAIFCASDDIAAGCLEVLSGHGLRVPEDISLVGFDDILTARMTSPPLTTIRQPFRRLGNRAVEMLLPQILNGIVPAVGTLRDAEGQAVLPATSGDGSEPLAAVPTPHTEVFDVELVVRRSVGPPP